MSLSYKWKIVLAVLAGTFMVMIDATIVNIALPHILAVFNDNINRVQFVTSAYLIATAISARPPPSSAPASAAKGFTWPANWVFWWLHAERAGLEHQCPHLLPHPPGRERRPAYAPGNVLIFTNVPKEEQGTAMGIFGVPMILARPSGPPWVAIW